MPFSLTFRVIVALLTFVLLGVVGCEESALECPANLPSINIASPADGLFVASDGRFTISGSHNRLPAGGRLVWTLNRQLNRQKPSNTIATSSPGNFAFPAQLMTPNPDIADPKQDPAPFHPLHAAVFEVLDAAGNSVEFCNSKGERVSQERRHVVWGDSVAEQGTALVDKSILVRGNDNYFGTSAIERQAQMLINDRFRNFLPKKNPLLTIADFQKFLGGTPFSGNAFELNLDYVASIGANGELKKEGPLDFKLDLVPQDDVLAASLEVRQLSVGITLFDRSPNYGILPDHCRRAYGPGLCNGEEPVCGDGGPPPCPSGPESAALRCPDGSPLPPCIPCAGEFRIVNTESAKMTLLLNQTPDPQRPSRIDVDQVGTVDIQAQCSFIPDPAVSQQICQSAAVLNLASCTSGLSQALQKKIVGSVIDDPDGKPDDPKDEDGLAAREIEEALGGFDLAGQIGESANVTLNVEFDNIVESAARGGGDGFLLYKLDAGVRNEQKSALQGCLQVKGAPPLVETTAFNKSPQNNEYGLASAISYTALNQAACASQAQNLLDRDVEKIPDINTGAIGDATGARVRSLLGVDEIIDPNFNGSVGRSEKLKLRLSTSGAPPVIDPFLLRQFPSSERDILLLAVGLSGLKVDVLTRAGERLLLSFAMDTIAGFSVDPRRRGGVFLPVVHLLPGQGAPVQCSDPLLSSDPKACKRVSVEVMHLGLTPKSGPPIDKADLARRIKQQLFKNFGLAGFAIDLLLTTNVLPYPTVLNTGVKSVDSVLSRAPLANADFEKNYLMGFFAFGITPELDRIGPKFVNANRTETRIPTLIFPVIARPLEAAVGVDFETFPELLPTGARFRKPPNVGARGEEVKGVFEWEPLLDEVNEEDQTGIHTVQFVAVTANSQDRRNDDFRIRESVKIYVCQPDSKCEVRLLPIGNQTIASGQELVFPIQAEGPPDFEIEKDLKLSLREEPKGSLPGCKLSATDPNCAKLIDDGKGSARFLWIPNRSQRGCHDVTFVVESDDYVLDSEKIVIVVDTPAAACVIDR